MSDGEDFDWDDFLGGDKPDWGIFPLPICACGQMTERDCQQDCISDSVICYDYEDLDAQFDELLVSFGVQPTTESPPEVTDIADEVTDFEQEFISCGPRVGSLEDFDMDDIHVAETIDSEHGDSYEDFPTLDLPDPGRAEVVDTYLHPDDRFIYMEIRRWPDGQERHLLRSYK